MSNKSKNIIVIFIAFLGLSLALYLFAFQGISLLQRFDQDSQIKPLVADETHHVVVLEDCDLAVRFKKGTKIQKTSETSISFSKNDETDIKKVFLVNCYDVLRASATPKANYNYFPDNLLKDGGKSVFYDDFDINTKTKNGEIANLVNNKTVVIKDDFDFKQEFDITLQPNSLAPSTPSVKLTESASSSVNSSPVSVNSSLTSNNASVSKSSNAIIPNSVNQKTTEIKLYLGDITKVDTDCGATSVVTRQIPQTEGVVKAALLELFRGETSEEKGIGLSSSFKNWQEVLASVNLKADGTLQIDLKKEVLPQKQADGSFTDKYNWGTFGSSCGSGQMQQIRQTAKQFPSVKYVIFSVNGLLQSPDNFVGCPQNSQKIEGLENDKWEELKRQCGL